MSSIAMRARLKTGYCFDELMMWHNPGHLQAVGSVEPTQHWENVATKRRFHNLVAVSGLLDELHPLKARAASLQELHRVHEPGYVETIKTLSADETKGHHTSPRAPSAFLPGGGDGATFGPGGFEIASRSAGAAVQAVDAVLGDIVKNAYVLNRPPGHHAESSEGCGFCIFNNIAVAAAHAMDVRGLKRIAIVDWDVHHGNGTQRMFEEDDRVLFISLHQDNNYPLNSGLVSECGRNAGEGYTINIPLPPGSGSGAYKAAFSRVVEPAINIFKPELILVSSGFDASFMDNLAAMILGSHDYRWMTERLMELADSHCSGRLAMFHEGGYSELYVPFCGLAVMEALSGVKTEVEDPFWVECSNWGYQSLQIHQDAAITQSEAVLEKLKERTSNKKSRQ